MTFSRDTNLDCPLLNPEQQATNSAPPTHCSWERPTPTVVPAQQLVYPAPNMQNPAQLVPAGQHLAPQPVDPNSFHGQYRHLAPVSQGSERLNQVAFLQSRTTLVISPTAITGLASTVMQVETQIGNPHHPVTLSVGHGPHALATTLQNLEWVGFDLTYSFTDHRSTTRVGCNTGFLANQGRHLTTPTWSFPSIQPGPNRSEQPSTPGFQSPLPIEGSVRSVSTTRPPPHLEGGG